MINYIQKHQNKIYLASIIGLFAFYCFILFYRLGVHPIIDWDESIYAQIAKDALRNNHWFNFQFYGQPWYHKPPLGIWFVSWSFAIGGVSDFMARFPTALATAITVALSLRWVYEIRKRYLPVLVTMIAYFIMYSLLINAFFLNLDTIAGLFVLLSLYAWWKLFFSEDLNEKSKRNWFLVLGLSIGLGVMVKSVVALFPVVPMAMYIIAQRQLWLFKDRRFWFGVLAAIIIILPWHLYQSLVAGMSFWNEYFVYHILQRYSSNLENNGAPFWFFFDNVFFRHREVTLVFGGSMLASIYLAWKDRAIRFLLISALVLFLIFSSAITKLVPYIAMALPLVVMLAGLSITKLLDLVSRSYLKIIVVLVFAVTVLYVSWQFNEFKIIKSESAMEYLDNKKIGLFLKDFHSELPVYITDRDYQNLSVAYYADRPVLAIPDGSHTIDAKQEGKQRIMHTRTQTVFLADSYILIVR